MLHPFHPVSILMPFALFFCLVCFLGVCCFCLLVLCLVFGFWALGIPIGIQFTSNRDGSRWPTRLNRSLGYAKKKKEYQGRDYYTVRNTWKTI